MRRRRFPPRVYWEIVARQKGICGCGCGRPLGSDPRGIEFDHVVALADGGPDTPDNIQALIVRHHRSKSSREAIARAKARRISERDGLLQRRLNRGDRALAKMLEGSDG